MPLFGFIDCILFSLFLGLIWLLVAIVMLSSLAEYFEFKLPESYHDRRETQFTDAGGTYTYVPAPILYAKVKYARNHDLLIEWLRNRYSK